MKRAGISLLLWFALWSSPALAFEREDMQLTDLAADAHLLLGDKRVLLLVLTRSDCSYCKALMKNVMLPLLRSGAWDEHVLIRELELDTSPKITDFSSQLVTALEFAERYGTPFTPSILFLDNCGREAGLRQVGYDGSEFFEFYLQKSVKQALKWLATQASPCSRINSVLEKHPKNGVL